MAGDLDIIGTVAVDVVPIAANLHTRLKAAVLPAADRVGREAGERMGEAISRHITVAIPNAINNGGQAARTAATRQGDDNAGAFGRAFKRRLEVAFRSLPRPDVRLSTTGFDADLARVRSRMESLSNKRIGVDVDAATALAELESIDAELARLGERSPNIQIRSDIATARAELAEMQRAANALDRERVTVRVKADTGEALSALRALGIAVAGVAALPVIPVAAAGIGAIASAAVAAGAGVGALALAAVPAIKGVTDALTAKTAAEKQSAQATDNSAASNVKAAQSALQMASAQAQLSSAHRQAAQSIAQANRAVEDAERSLSDAKRAARQAEDDLTAARKDAAAQLRDLNDQLLDGLLDQREATLRVAEAKADLDKTLADPKATDLQRERAQLTYDEAVRNADKQKAKNAELKKSVEDANKAGVDSSANVKQAADRVADAQRKVADQTRAVADAQAKARDAQVQAADSIASAERGLQAARLSSVDTTAQAVTKADEYRTALSKLTPEQRKLYDAIAGPKGITAAFKDWSVSLSPDVVPLLTRAVNGAKAALPGLTPLVKTAADAVGILFDKASAELKSPFWRDFKRDIELSAKPAIVGLGVAFGNVFKGMAGVIDAFLPHMGDISSTLQRVTRRFADWGTGLKGSPEFERFLRYAADKGPLIAETLGRIAGAFLDIGSALSPLSGPLLQVIGALADGIGWLAQNVPGLVVGLYGLYVVVKLVTLAQFAWNAAALAFDVIAKAGPWGWIILGITAVVVAIVYAWNRFDWFRNGILTVWTAIQTAALYAWEKVLRPAFDGIWWAIKKVADIAVWLWQNVLSPVFKFIWLAARVLFAILVVAVLTPIWIAIQAVGDIAVWLWQQAIRPAFNAIASIATWLWTKQIRPFLTGFWDGLKWLGDKFVWLYDRAVKPAANWIADKSKWLWNKALSPALHWIWDGLKWLGDKFKWLYDKAVAPVVGDISDKASWLYAKGLKPAFDKVRSAVGLVGDAFKKARDAIGKAWGQVADIAKKPVNFIIEWVYTKGIKAVWDKVAKFVDLDPLPKAPKLLAAGGTVGDGWGAARPMKTNRPTAIVGEGNPSYPEYVIPTDPKYRGRAQALWHAAGTQLLAGGGVLGDAWEWTKDKVGGAISKGIDWAKTGADLLANPSKIWAKLMKPILDKVAGGVGASPMGRALAQFPVKMVEGLKDKIVDAVTFSGGDIGGSIPSGQRKSIITRAMAAAHVPPPGTVAQWLAGMNTLITRESGWNPNAINLWDSNAKAGHPSQGLTQTIPGTFNAYVPPALKSRGILDPVANVAASIRYIVSRYGNITNVAQANANHAPQGYDSGGWLMPGFTTTYNGTGKPEAVFTHEQWADIRAAKGGGGTTVNNEVRVFVGDKEITDIVRTEIYTHDANTAADINNGRYV